MTSHRQLGILGLIAVVVLAIGATDLPKRTVFADMEVGQPVGLKDHGATYEISVLDGNVPQSHKVVEIGNDFIVLEDITEVTQTTIPVYSVRSIVRFKMK